MDTLKYQIKVLESAKSIAKGCLIGGGELKIRGLALKEVQGLVYPLLKRLLSLMAVTSEF
jgi:hypothetical protein